jgi:DNA helicase TIP49 (TBP-interacting protein)
MPAYVNCELNGEDEVRVEDIETVYDLFLDVKRSSDFLKKGGQKFLK